MNSCPGQLIMLGEREKAEDFCGCCYCFFFFCYWCCWSHHLSLPAINKFKNWAVNNIVRASLRKLQTSLFLFRRNGYEMTKIMEANTNFTYEIKTLLNQNPGIFQESHISQVNSYVFLTRQTISSNPEKRMIIIKAPSDYYKIMMWQYYCCW